MSDKFDDLTDGLGDLSEPSYTAYERKGAPQIDAPSLDGLLDEPVNTWTTTERKGAPKIEEPILLDDPAPSWTPTEKKGAPKIEEPILLDDPSPSYQATSTVQTPQQALPSAEELMANMLVDDEATYDPIEEFYGKLQFTDDLKKTFEGLDAEKQIQVVEMRAKQMGIAIPQIPRELRPQPRVEETEEASIEVELEEAPKPKEYVSRFKDEDLERAKEESKKVRYTPPPQQELTEEKKRENRRIMNELREERERDQAKQGFKQLVLLAVVGILGAIAFSSYFSGAFGLGYTIEEEMEWISYIKSYAPYYGVVVGVGSLACLAPISALKSLMTLVDSLGFILSLFPGLLLLTQKEGSTGINALILVVGALLMGYCAMQLVTSEKIQMYYKHGGS